MSLKANFPPSFKKPKTYFQASSVWLQIHVCVCVFCYSSAAVLAAGKTSPMCVCMMLSFGQTLPLNIETNRDDK